MKVDWLAVDTMDDKVLRDRERVSDEEVHHLYGFLRDWQRPYTTLLLSTMT